MKVDIIVTHVWYTIEIQDPGLVIITFHSMDKQLPSLVLLKKG